MCKSRLLLSFVETQTLRCVDLVKRVDNSGSFCCERGAVEGEGDCLGLREPCSGCEVFRFCHFTHSEPC